MSMYERSILEEEGYNISNGNEKIVIGNGKSRSISFLYCCPFLESFLRITASFIDYAHFHQSLVQLFRKRRKK